MKTIYFVDPLLVFIYEVKEKRTNNLKNFIVYTISYDIRACKNEKNLCINCKHMRMCLILL